ncbi:MAG: transketolase [Bacteroidales bacterium]|jgi:transketolase|nr:transketolase [Bacteroidales bacterium]
MSKPIVDLAADTIRILSAAMVEKASSGHPGGAMGGADFINILYSEFLNFNPDDPAWPLRDRFFLDPGHMSPMLYSVLHLCGYYSTEDLKNFRQWKSITPGHPELDVLHGIENTSGPLGQGHAMAVGSAIAERFLAARFGEWMAHKTFAFISDGGIQEEISQGAGRIAGYLGLNNLVMFYDANNVQLSTKIGEVTSEDTGMKYRSWNWYVQTINGNNALEIREAISNALAEKQRPSLIIGKTIMGFGAVDPQGNSMEGLTSTHGQPLSKAGVSLSDTIRKLGGDPDNPFEVSDEVKEYYRLILSKKRIYTKDRDDQMKAWKDDNPNQALLWNNYTSGEVPDIDTEAIPIKPDAPTRNTSGDVLSYFSKSIGNMIVMSADLSNSDKTEGFLKHSRPFQPGDLNGGFLHAGVSELTMAAIANGIALHGGLFVVCGTFFVFSDYMKPAIRLAALMRLPVKYVFTHDSFRVGEDGPTHQPVEHEMQLRLLEQLKNHRGHNSLLVLRPADSAETIISWKLALENTETPTALILSRQNIKDIPAPAGSTRLKEASCTNKGAYTVYEPENEPDVILLANGSEVSTLIECAFLLKNDHNIQARVVSAPSEGLFQLQDEHYRKSIIPDNTPVFGLTAGLPVTLKNLAGCKGKVFGLEHFGYSAPFQVLDEQFGFNPLFITSMILKINDNHIRRKTSG